MALRILDSRFGLRLDAYNAVAAYAILDDGV